MKKHSAVVAAYLLACPLHVSGAEVSTVDSLFGLWVATEKTRGGITHIMEYRSNGVAISTMRVIMKGGYTYTNGQLALQFDGDGNVAMKAVQAGETLVLGDKGSDNYIEFKRQNPGQGNLNKGIVGQWIGKNKKAQYEMYIFRDDARMLWQKPMPGHTVSNFVVTGNRMEISRDGKVQGVITWTVDGDQLTLSGDGKKFVYQRAAN